MITQVIVFLGNKFEVTLKEVILTFIRVYKP
jgi:hypothetical protein